MRIISYNILDGGEGRADPLAEVILAQRVDVVALVEADDPAVVDRIARRADMDVVRATGRRHGAALLSRWPIMQSVDHTRLRAGATLTNVLLEAVVQDPAGREWPIFVTHLHARATEADEDARLREVEAILHITEAYRTRRRAHWLVGDLNSTSAHQLIDAESLKPSTRTEYAENGSRLPVRVMQSLFDAGYVDTLHAHRPDYARSAGTFSTQFPGQRVDYVLAWGVPVGQIRDAWIEHDRLAKYASDHFPVGAEIGSAT